VFAVHFNRCGNIEKGAMDSKFVHIFDLVGIGFFSAADMKHFGHASAVIRMGAAPPAIIRIKLRAAMVLAVAPHRPFRVVLALDSGFRKREAARPHGAVFTAGALYADIAGFHVFSPVKTVSIPVPGPARSSPESQDQWTPLRDPLVF
jgi:hypothetical protein